MLQGPGSIPSGPTILGDGMRILVTGCLGFVGSHFLKHMFAVDKKVLIRGFSRYSSLRNEDRFDGQMGNLEMIFGDVTADISGIMDGVDVVVNFAAKTDVGHSIRDPGPFVQANILGTYNLLEQAHKYRPALFVQISTGDVYGPYGQHPSKEFESTAPTNPYAGTKAAADSLVASYGNVYNLPYVITRAQDNFGTFQSPYKILPRFIKQALAGESIRVLGDGKFKHRWMRVEDHCSAIWFLIQWAQKYGGSSTFNIGSGQEIEELELARRVLAVLEKPEDRIEFVPEQLSNCLQGFDVDTQKLTDLGWKPKYSSDESLTEVIEWYRDNRSWFV